MKPGALIILQVCALAVFLAGALAVIIAVRRNAVLSGTIQSKIETLVQLREMKQVRDSRLAALHVFEGLSNACPAALADLSRAVVTNAMPEIRERETRNLAEGWTLRQMEVVFSEIALGRLPDFLRAAENQRPPWRLAECTITSSRRADGLGRAVLIMEAAGKGAKPDGGRRTMDDGRQMAED